jgi:hypothetical protein
MPSTGGEYQSISPTPAFKPGIINQQASGMALAMISKEKSLIVLSLHFNCFTKRLAR